VNNAAGFARLADCDGFVLGLSIYIYANLLEGGACDGGVLGLSACIVTTIAW
jgi:hypothetical protein